MNLTEIELYGTPRVENLNFTLSICNESSFGIPKVWNGLFQYFQKSNDLEIEEKMLYK